MTDAKRKRESRTQGYHRPLLAKSAQAQAVKIPPLSVSSLPPSLLRPNYPPLPNTAAKPEKSTREKYITHVTCCSSGPQSDVFHAFEQREIIVFPPSLYLRLALQRQVLPTELIFCALQPCVWVFFQWKLRQPIVVRGECTANNGARGVTQCLLLRSRCPLF